MWLEILAVLGGVGVLVWGADRFVTGAAALARNLHVSTLMIGLTVVGLGTSAPEILVSMTAALNGNAGLSVGNAIGSNIANIGLILGITALLVPIRVQSGILRREYPLVLAAACLALLLLWDLHLGRLDGLLMWGALAGIIWRMFHLARLGSPGDPLVNDLDSNIPADMRTERAILWLAIGLIALLASSRALVWGAVQIAVALGVSDLVIGLTIVAVGTSLPELAASLSSVFKGEHNIALGNVLGSNVYNLLAVLSVPALLAPGAVPGDVVSRDMPLMILLTLAIFVMSHWRFSPNRRINRWEGGLLLLGFIGYQFSLFSRVTANV